MSDEEAADYQALKAEYDALEAEHAEADELPDEVDARLGEIEEAMEALEAVRSGSRPTTSRWRGLRQHRQLRAAAGRARLCAARG